MPQPDSAIQSGPSAQQRLPLARVLAVDDEASASKLLSALLRPAGYLCAAAQSGEQALAAMDQEPFDAIISDLGMPGMGGMELLAEVRRRNAHITFLVTTGVDDVEVGVKAMCSGADDYLVKPLQESVVLASLERALHKRDLERQIENYRQHLERMVTEQTEQVRAALESTERSYEDTLRALGAAIDLRDSNTAGHSQRVCRYSLEIGRAMALPDRQLQNPARGAYLHDIGKLGVADRILLKPGPLTDEERSIMQRHVEIGFELVRGIPFLSDAAEIVLCHHERFDGSGYPRGLRDVQISPGARIFPVADTFDAITSDRPYRRASSFNEGRETIRFQSGSQFDPQVVDAFLRVAPETWPVIARAGRSQNVSFPSVLTGS